MNVLIVNNLAPFVWGGAEELALNLEKALIEAGHDAETLRIPFQWEPSSGIAAQMLMVRSMELWNVDRVIALKFPAYLIRHPHKTLWLVHQYRQAYDLFEAGQSNIPQNAAGDELRAVIRNADNESFAECRGMYTISEVTQRRLAHFNGLHADVLLPPLNDAQMFVGASPGDYILAAGRINLMKRQHLLVEAMRHADAGVRLRVVGPPDSPADGERLVELVERHGLGDRVELVLGFLPRQDYANHVNHARAVAYVPFDEDAMSYVMVEAATAGRPLLTTSDSGGLLNLVRHDDTGFVVEPDPQALGRALSKLWSGGSKGAELGRSARARWLGMNVTWQSTVETLLA